MKKTISVKKEHDRVRLISEITYSQVPSWFGNTIQPLKLSLLKPERNDNKPYPLIIWICGGAWIDMDKDVWIPELVPFTKRGYAVASVEYRVSSQAKFPAQLEDIKTAIRFMRANATRFHIDPDRISVMGESAGGYLAALAGTTGEENAFDVGEWLTESSKVQAVVDWYGPTDFMQFDKRPTDVDFKMLVSPEELLIGGNIQDNKEKYQKSNPINYITHKTPPFLILHGKQDNLVPIQQSELLYEALIAHGVEANFYEIEGAGHATVEFNQPAIQECILEFLDRHFTN